MAGWPRDGSRRRLWLRFCRRPFGNQEMEGPSKHQQIHADNLPVQFLLRTDAEMEPGYPVGRRPNMLYGTKASPSSAISFLMEFICDKNRHLVCIPYSEQNLHKMASLLGIKSCWFHKTHYDIPARRIDEITKQCRVVSSKEVVRIIKHH